MNTVVQQPSKIRKFYKETMRVLRITKKPDRNEFMSLSKVCGLGIAIIGIVGFLIFLLKHILIR
jgi:protein transport protein SEC61 subunit gamma and related proteins